MTNTYTRASERNTYDDAAASVSALTHLHKFDTDDEIGATPVSGDMLAVINRGTPRQLDRRLGGSRHLNLVIS